MAPKTRSAGLITPPKSKPNKEIYTTRQRVRFYDAWDNREPGTSLRQFCLSHQPGLGTASRWLHQRDTLGSPSYHRIRRLSQKLGRPPKVSEKQCKMLVSPSKNPVRDQMLEAQIEHHKLEVTRRSLTSRLKACTKRARRFKQAYVKKEISGPNRKKREDYSREHKDKTIHDFWQYIYFTDEAHIDLSS